MKGYVFYETWCYKSSTTRVTQTNYITQMITVDYVKGKKRYTRVRLRKMSITKERPTGQTIRYYVENYLTGFNFHSEEA